MNVYREMLFEVLQTFNVGDFRILELHEIECFYEALRSGLKNMTTPTPSR